MIMVSEAEMYEVPQIRKIQNSLPSNINTDKSELYHLLEQRGNIGLLEDERSKAREFANRAVANLMAQEHVDLDAISRLPLQEQIKEFSNLKANHYKAFEITKRLTKSSQIEYSSFKDPHTTLNQVSKHH